jgi:phosphoribosylaminoimidazole-succinocarboxamide synthase
MGNALDQSLEQYRGKGKSLYRIPAYSELLLMVMSDRLSTHNVVHATEILGKGELIAAPTLFMLREVFGSDVPTHIVAAGREIYDYIDRDQDDPNLHYRAFVVRRTAPPTIEHILRSYNVGSLRKAIEKDGTDPYGHMLPPDLPLMHRFPEPLFTPTKKSKLDEPLNAALVFDRYPAETALARDLYLKVQAYLAKQGITLIDAKLELSEGVLIDDWFNGDCARMAFQGDVRRGVEPPFLDKERFRKMAEKKWGDDLRVPLSFSDKDIDYGLAGYHTALAAITGLSLSDFRTQYFDA